MPPATEAASVSVELSTPLSTAFAIQKREEATGKTSAKELEEVEKEMKMQNFLLYCIGYLEEQVQ